MKHKTTIYFGKSATNEFNRKGAENAEHNRNHSIYMHP